jgi:hypothetical protein
MPQDWGWVELREPLTERTVARAHVHAERANDGRWHGHLDTVRLAPGQPRLVAGPYFAQFGHEQGTHLVRIEPVGDGMSIRSEGPGLPAVASELAEGS